MKFGTLAWSMTNAMENGFYRTTLSTVSMQRIISKSLRMKKCEVV